MNLRIKISRKQFWSWRASSEQIRQMAAMSIDATSKQHGFRFRPPFDVAIHSAFCYSPDCFVRTYRRGTVSFIFHLALILFTLPLRVQCRPRVCACVSGSRPSSTHIFDLVHNSPAASTRSIAKHVFFHNVIARPFRLCDMPFSCPYSWNLSLVRPC